MESKNPAILTPRDREILKDVILTYILTAEPVSSRSVAKHGQLGLSAASIRNVMADLEEWGFLAQPQDRKSTRLNSSHSQSSYAVFCLKKRRRRSSPTHSKLHRGSKS